MPLLSLAWKSVSARTAPTVLTLIAIAFSTALVLGVEKIRTGARSGFEQTVSGADLIVGARSGSVNLLLYAVFRIGEPTTNVSWKSYETFAERADVAWTIPLALGDSHGGFRVLGTTEAYFDHYQHGNKQPLAFAVGDRFRQTHDAVLGAEAARELGYPVGAEFTISHGIKSAAFAQHADQPFSVVGILAPSGTPVDRTIHISLAGMDAIHARFVGGAPSAITAFIVGLKSKATVLRYQRDVNTYRGEALSGVMPGVALAQLWRVLRPAEQALRGVSFLVVAAGLMGLLTALLSTLNERRREIAVFRAVGARSRDVLTLLVLESTLVAGLGAVIGAISLNLVLAGFGANLEAMIGAPLSQLWFSARDGIVVAVVASIGFLLGFVPGWIAYRRSLNDGLTIRW
ncbi:MAG: ABC transporter permease [Pseudomonadota bacterium]